MLRNYGSRFNFNELDLAQADLKTMASLGGFAFGYIERYPNGLRVVSFWNIPAGPQEIRGQMHTDDYAFGMPAIVALNNKPKEGCDAAQG